MENFLALTMADETPAHLQGKGASFDWRWLARGVLEFTPEVASERALVLSAGIHGNESLICWCGRCFVAN